MSSAAAELPLTAPFDQSLTSGVPQSSKRAVSSRRSRRAKQRPRPGGGALGYPGGRDGEHLTPFAGFVESGQRKSRAEGQDARRPVPPAGGKGRRPPGGRRPVSDE